MVYWCSSLKLSGIPFIVICIGIQPMGNLNLNMNSYPNANANANANANTNTNTKLNPNPNPKTKMHCCGSNLSWDGYNYSQRCMTTTYFWGQSDWVLNYI